MLWAQARWSPMELDYLLIDVFTDRPFGGSRLSLFPRGAEVPVGVMQKIAMEMGCGETAFILPGFDPERRSAGLRVFTPCVEIPFAGHSVIGATFALDRLGRLERENGAAAYQWELESGTYRVTVEGEGREALIFLRQDDPLYIGQYFQRAKVARALGLPEQEIAITGMPCEIISTGLPTHIVPVGTLEAVGSIELRRREADAIARDLGFGDLLVFTMETEDPAAQVHCRMFAPHFGIPEDPASGSGAGALAAYLIKHRLLRSATTVELVVEQGIEMGRPSTLVVRAAVSEDRATDIRVGGRCVLVGRGTIELPEDWDRS